MTWQDWDKAVMALCLWREARGEPLEGQVAIAHVILNRLTPNQSGVTQTIAGVVEAKWQFSSMTAVGDGQLIIWPMRPNPQFEQCMQVVEDALNGVSSDPTGGATHYFNPSVVLPSWAATMTKVCTIGHHDFYK